MNLFRRTLWLYGFLALLAGPLLAAEYTGRVVAISDGDTLTLLVPDGASFKQVKVRLGEIDTPESRQPYGQRAKQALSDLAFGQQARVVVQDTDRYGRTVGRVYVGGVDVNAEMVQPGGGVGVPQIRQGSIAVRLEEQAKAAKRGLWGLPEAATLPALGLAARECARPTSAPAPVRRLPRPLPRPQPPAAVSPAPASGIAGK